MNENQYERLVKQQKIYIVFDVLLLSNLVILFIVNFIFWIIKGKTLITPFFLSFVIVAVLACIFIFYINKKRGGFSMKGYLKIENKGKSSIIEIDGIKKSFIEKKKEEFFCMYHDKNILEENYEVDIQSIGEKCFLIFNQPIEFKTFAFWVNYLSFLDGQEYNVTGRYPAGIGIQTTGGWRSGISFLNSEKDIMVCCQNKNEWDKNNVYCVLDNQFGFIKPLYLARYLFDKPPSYRFILPLDQSIPLIDINPLFGLKNIKEYGEKILKKYRERPNIKIKDCKQQKRFVVKQKNEERLVNRKKEVIIGFIVLLILFGIGYLCKMYEQNKEKNLEMQSTSIETVFNLNKKI